MKVLPIILAALTFFNLRAFSADILTLRERVAGVAFGAAKYIVMGERGGVYLSPDLRDWKFQKPEGVLGWSDVAFGQTTFVASGFSQSVGLRSGILASSADGVRWTERLRLGELLLAVVFAEDRFLALGDKGSLFNSVDGVSWERASSGTQLPFRAATHGDGRFVLAGGQASSPAVVTSSDLRNWMPQNVGIDRPVWGLAFGTDMFVAAAGYDSFADQSTLFTSKDALTWTAKRLEVPVGVIGVAFGNGRFVAVGDQGTILTSEDTMTWRKANSPVNEHLVDVRFVGGRFMAIWVQSTSGMVTSLDGLNWETVGFNTDGRPRFKPSFLSHQDGVFRMRIEPQGARRLLLEGSSNLQDWSVLHEIPVQNSEFLSTSDLRPNTPQRFYRVRALSD